MLLINFIIIDNILINNEPAIKLIDNLLDKYYKVIDWNILLNISNKNNK